MNQRPERQKPDNPRGRALALKRQRRLMRRLGLLPLPALLRRQAE